MRRGASARLATLARLAALLGAALCAASAQAASADCAGAPGDKPLYLTFDTGHMGVAELVAEVLKRQGVRATFFLANERTLTGGGSLDDAWAAWWKARAGEGHTFGSHTWDHVYWLADRPQGFRVRPSAGPAAGKTFEWTSAQYCAELTRPGERFRAMTGQSLSPIFRAPGGKTSPALLAAAKACGWSHAGWSAAGFLGDELPSDRYPNAVLLSRALRDIKSGDILLAHLGIWSRRDPWAPAVLEPLIAGLKAKGHCFATLAEHPQYRDAARR